MHSSRNSNTLLKQQIVISNFLRTEFRQTTKNSYGKTKEALDLPKKNEIIINEVNEKQKATRDELKPDLSERITTQVKEDLYINNIRTQLKGVLIEFDDFRNQPVKSNLILKGFLEDSNETWVETSQLLAGFITEKLIYPILLTAQTCQSAEPTRQMILMFAKREIK